MQKWSLNWWPVARAGVVRLNRAFMSKSATLKEPAKEGGRFI